jgi:hypothetical protein
MVDTAMKPQWGSGFVIIRKLLMAEEIQTTRVHIM